MTVGAAFRRTTVAAMLCAAAGLEVRELAARDGMTAGILAAPSALVGPLLEVVA